MKSIIAVCIILLVCQSELFAQNTGYTHEFVNRVANWGSNFVEIPGTFSDNEISKSKIDQALQGKTIEKIELIYTQFKLNPNFDQVKLNNDRITELQKAFPDAKNNGIDWVWVEQTGAKTIEDARDYYHGFRIYYSNPTSETIAETIENKEESDKFYRFQFEDQANKPTQYVVNNSKGGDIKHPSGTVIHVPAYCVLTPDGKPVVGSYTIEYTEYRDAAQIAYSGIPMEYSENGEKFNFSSVGMYELRGNQNNQELSLTKPITVDFNTNEVAEEVSFYEMDDQTGEWVKKHDINYTEQETETVSEANGQPVSTVFMNQTKGFAMEFPIRIGIAGKRKFGKAMQVPTAKDKDPNKKLKELTLTEPMMEKYLDLQKNDKAFIDKVVIKDNLETMEITINEYNEEVFTNKIMGIEPIVLNPEMMTADYSVAGHTFPSMVMGLNSPNFGVYNCDQIQRIHNAVTAAPTYEMDGSMVSEKFAVACVIDRRVNGSFSFTPRYLTYNQLSNTTILLFDEKGNLSAVTEEEVKKTNGSATPQFVAVDLSKTVHNSVELKKYLNL